MRMFLRDLVLVVMGSLGIAASANDDPLAHYRVAASATHHAEAIEASRAEVLELMASGAPGVSIAVGVDGRIVWAEGFGYANVEHRVAVTPATKFRIGSVSKAMTTIAMGVLLEEDRIDLDVPIQDYLPGFPASPAGVVTARHLASHRGGVRHYLTDGSDYLVRDHYDDVVEALAVFEENPFAAPPGAQFLYSSHGFNLLSAVMQRAADRPFLELMRDRIFSPMGLIETVADHADAIVMDRAAPYERNSDGALQNAYYVDNSYKWAGGGFLSTPSDLVRFGFAAVDGTVISTDTMDLLAAPPAFDDGAPVDQNYGLGWQDYGDGWIGHGGGSVGGNTAFYVHREDAVVVAIVCNLSACLNGNSDLVEVRDLFRPDD